MDRLTPAQMRGARGMLGWSMVDLSKASGLSVSTVKRMEMATPQSVSDDAYRMARAALEEAGVRFFEGDGEVGAALRVGWVRASRPPDEVAGEIVGNLSAVLR